jgi:hypothetical protein
MVDIYACFDDQESTRAKHILVEAGIEVLVRDRSSHDFPTHFGDGTKQTIAVPSGEVDRAREIVGGAVTDGVLPEGQLLSTPAS